MDILPRDLQLKVIKHFDIDTRLRLGILPCKLKVPETFKIELVKPTTENYYCVVTKSLIITWDEYLLEKSISVLGEYWISNLEQTKWMDIDEYGFK